MLINHKLPPYHKKKQQQQQQFSMKAKRLNKNPVKIEEICSNFALCLHFLLVHESFFEHDMARISVYKTMHLFFFCFDENFYGYDKGIILNVAKIIL